MNLAIAAAPPRSTPDATRTAPEGSSRKASFKRFTSPLRSSWRDLVIVSVLLVAALPFRLANLATVPANSDEGIRMAQLFLMTEGYRPIRDIFASQGPLSLDATYPLFALFGGSLAAARLAVVAYSLAGIAATYLLARQLAGRGAGGVAGALLVLSPVYLENSRTALVEVPALLPATLAIVATLRFRRSGSRGWLAASVLLLTTACLIKPIVAAAGAPILFLLTAQRRSLGELVFAAALASGLTAAVVLAYGPSQVYDQVIRYRAGSAEAEGWNLAANLDVLYDELRRESTSWIWLAAGAAPTAVLTLGWRALPALVWAAGTLVLLLLYTPLMTKHPVVLLPPAAVLVGCAFSGLLGALRRLRGTQEPLGGWRRRAPIAAAVAGSGLVLWYAASVPDVLARDRRVAGIGAEPRAESQLQDAELLAALTAPDDFIVVDEPYLSYLSRRRVPPTLADPTTFRVRSGTLSGADVVAAAGSHQVAAMLLWTDGLRDLKKFGEWLDQHYQPVKIYERRNGKDRSLYLRTDLDLTGARGLVRGDLATSPTADFGGVLRLSASGLDQENVRAGAALQVSTEWEALAPMLVDYKVVAMLNDHRGEALAQIERSLGGGGLGTSAWQPGRWTVRTFFITVPPRTPAGEYSVAVSIYDSKARVRLPLSSGASAALSATIGTVRVR